MVPPRGIEPRPLDFQSSASTWLAWTAIIRRIVYNCSMSVAVHIENRICLSRVTPTLLLLLRQLMAQGLALSLANQERLELSTFGFGDRRSAN